MQKECTRCAVTKNLTEFVRRAASHDGRSAACADCLRTSKRSAYHGDEEERAATIRRTIENKQRRFEREAGYRRAFVLWGSTKRRTRIPPWVAIADFLPVCRLAEDLGPDFDIDHVIPLKHPLVCGLHVPQNVRVLPTVMNSLRGNSVLTIDELNEL